jgi:hypothetical protein
MRLRRLHAAGLAMIVAGAVGLALSRGDTAPASEIVNVPASTLTLPAWVPAGTHASDDSVVPPVALTIPAIGVHTILIRLGRTAKGTLQVPRSFTVAGWYDLGPRPGQPGPAVIAGHVDNASGPAVFYRLRELRRGMRIYVWRADDTVVSFVVTGVAMYRKSGFPASEVYGPVISPQLRLITCGGAFDFARGSYLSDVVVYATQFSP